VPLTNVIIETHLVLLFTLHNTKNISYHILEVLIFYAYKLMVMGSSKNLCVFNFVILLKLRKFDAREICMSYSNNGNYGYYCILMCTYKQQARSTKPRQAVVKQSFLQYDGKRVIQPKVFKHFLSLILHCLQCSSFVVIYVLIHTPLYFLATFFVIIVKTRNFLAENMPKEVIYG